MAGEMGNFGQSKRQEDEHLHYEGKGMDMMKDGTYVPTEDQNPEEIKDTMDSYEDRQ